MRTVGLMVAMLVLAACSGAPATPEPTEAPTPAPTVKPWSLSVSGAKYGSHVALGDDLILTLTVTNSGSAANDLTRIALDGLGGHFDLDQCSPSCQDDGLLGTMFLDFPGVEGGGSEAITISLVATKLGRSDWSMDVYDAKIGDPVFQGQGSTVVGG